MSKTEFRATAHAFGREAAEWLADFFGVTRAQIELWEKGI